MLLPSADSGFRRFDASPFGRVCERIPTIGPIDEPCQRQRRTRASGSGDEQPESRRGERTARGAADRPLARRPGSASRTPLPPPPGPFAGVVFNRPIDQVLSYHVPSRLERIIRPGQRLRVPLGQGNKLTVGYCVRVDDAAPADLDPARIKDVAEVLDPLAADRCQDAGPHALDGRLLRLLLGPGARCRGARRRQEARGDPDRDVLDGARGSARGPRGRHDRPAADAQAGRRDGSSPARRVADAWPTSAGGRNARPAWSMPCAAAGWCVRCGNGCRSGSPGGGRRGITPTPFDSSAAAGADRADATDPDRRTSSGARAHHRRASRRAASLRS